MLLLQKRRFAREERSNEGWRIIDKDLERESKRMCETNGSYLRARTVGGLIWQIWKSMLEEPPQRIHLFSAFFFVLLLLLLVLLWLL